MSLFKKLYRKHTDPQDQLEFNAQVMAEPQKYTTIAEAYDPKVIIKNEIFPRDHEIYNCTSCKYGGPNLSANPERFYNRCGNPKSRTWGVWCEGKRWNDYTDKCGVFVSKIPHPKDGFMPGVER